MAWNTIATLAGLGDTSAAALINNTNSATRAALSNVFGPSVADQMADDATIAQAAVSAMSDAAVQAQLAWKKTDITTGSLDTVTTAGLYSVTSAGGTTSKPVETLLGSLTVAAGTYMTQTFTSWETVPRMWTRRWSGSAWNAWAPISWRAPDVPAGFDFNTAVTPGYQGVITGSTTNGPGAGIGFLEVIVGGTGVVQRFTTYEENARVFLRRGATSGTGWLGWKEQASKAMLDTAIAGVTAAAPPSPSGTKRVPLSITLPGTTTTQTQAEGSARWVRQWAHMPSRIRVHISNRNPGNAVNGDAATLAAVKVGVGQADGSMTGIVDAYVSGTVPANGGELVGQWIDCPGTDGQWLGISVAWTGGAIQQVNQGYGWTNASASAVSDATVTGWTASQTTPFYVWIEAEVPSRVPVMVVNGDSISIGTAATKPVIDAWPNLYGIAEGALPVYYSQHGSALTHWTASSPRWDAFYPGVPVAADAVIAALGQNDLNAGITLDLMKTRYADVRTALSARFPGAPVYSAAITPSSKASDLELVRRNFNLWVQTSPHGERDHIRFDEAVGDPTDEFLAPEYSADGLHPNTAGQGVMAARLSQRPVTPFTLTTAKLRSL